MPSTKPPFLLSPAHMRPLAPHFPRSHDIPRVDDRRVLSGIVYVIRHGLQWRDALTQADHPARRRALPPTQPHRDHVWQTEGLAPRRDTLRPMCTRLLQCHHPGRHRHILAGAMSPDPR